MVLGNASAIKVGTTSQSKIYIGTTQVWPAGGGGDTDSIYLISLKGNGKTITIPSAGENTYGTIYNLPVGVTGLTFEIYCNGRQLDPNSEIIMVQGNWTSSVYYASTDNYGVSKTGAYNYNFNGVPSSSTGYLHMIFVDSNSGDMISFYLQR